MLTALELDFADGAYLFDLKLPQLIELQRIRNAGIFTIYGRVMQGRFVLEGGEVVGVATAGQAFVEDIFEAIRLGLIGGGRGIVNGAEVSVSAIRAKQLIETYCHAAPLRESWSIAAAILGARIEGYDPKPASKADAPKKKSRKQREKDEWIDEAAVITDCNLMGIDWREETWLSYTCALAGWNKRHDPNGDKPEPDFDRLRKFMSVH